MALIEINSLIPGGMGTILPIGGAPSAGTDEVQTLTFTGNTAGTFYLTLEGQETAAITWSSTNATLLANIDAALEALPNVGTGGVTTAAGSLTAGIGTVTCTFTGGNRTKEPLGGVMTRRMGTLDGTLTIARTTPGVAASFRGAGKGAVAVNTATGALSVNTGTANAPTWTAQV